MAGFQTLLGLGLAHDPITYRDIIDRRLTATWSEPGTHFCA